MASLRESGYMNRRAETQGGRATRTKKGKGPEARERIARKGASRVRSPLADTISWLGHEGVTPQLPLASHDYRLRVVSGPGGQGAAGCKAGPLTNTQRLRKESAKGWIIRPVTSKTRGWRNLSRT